jgi:hypothetical protein
MYDTSNAPPEVAALKTMLEASTTWVALTGTIHYPSVSVGDSASDVDPPYIVIEPVEDTPTTAAPGVILHSGTVQAVLFLTDSSGAAIEKSARAIAKEVQEQMAGLPILSAKVGMATEPTGADRASQEYQDQNVTGKVAATRSIAIIFTYGIT